MATNVRLIGGYLSDLASATASSTASGYDPANAVTLDRSSLWVAGGTSSVTLTFDCGATVSNVSGFGIANHNGSAWSTITIRGSTDNFAASDVSLKTISGIVSGQDYYAEVTPTSAYRYFRLAISSATSAPQVGIFYVGTTETLTYNPWVGMPDGPKWHVEKKQAQSGAVVAEQWGRAVKVIRMKWGSVETAAKDELVNFLDEEGGPLRPFFYVPREDSTTTTQGRAYLVRMVDETWREPEEIFGGLWFMSVDLQEEV